MKIKELILSTGLTDRTIRFYIEEGLISPEYTENYFGRKSFSFTEEDGETLRDISVLRGYGFTIAEIKELLFAPESCQATLEGVKARTEGEVLRGGELLQKIDALCDGKSHTLCEIASELRSCEGLILNEEKLGVRDILRLGASGACQLLIFAISVLPLALSLVLSFLSFILLSYKYPKISVFSCIALVFCFAVFVALFIAFNLKRRAPFYLKLVLIILSLIAIPISIVSSLGLVSHSETTSADDYLIFDMEPRSSLHPKYTELFPERREIISSSDEISYHYRLIGNGASASYDIFLERKFSSDAEFKEEAARLKALFNSTPGGKAYDFGSFDAYFLPWGESVPYEERWQEFYTYVFFALDEENCTVRYLYNEKTEFSGFDTAPYYEGLNWN